MAPGQLRYVFDCVRRMMKLNGVGRHHNYERSWWVVILLLMFDVPLSSSLHCMCVFHCDDHSCIFIYLFIEVNVVMNVDLDA